MSRKIVEEVLSIRDVKELWGTGYYPALPVTPQEYSMGGVLPIVLYMMRWGQRRGKGKFFDVFGVDATINDISKKLITGESFVGFNNLTEQAILGDLLLAFCFENKKRQTGRDEQIQRVFPTHYFSSWVDLPRAAAHLRGVPEMFTAIVSNQTSGEFINSNGKGHYSISGGFENNRLLSLFGHGTSTQDESNNLRSDEFDENTKIGIDQLLAIRIAHLLGEAPVKASGGSHNIPNQLPVATKAAKYFFEDFNTFIRSYGENIPRQSLLPMIESCIAIGTTNIYLSTLRILLNWSEEGFIPNHDKQSPWELFVDCSASTDDKLRRFSEESVDDLLQRMSRLTVIMMCLRIIDLRAKQERLENLPNSTPVPTDRINFLGDLINNRLESSRGINRDLQRDCNRLADAFTEAGDIHVKTLLENDDVHPAWRMAEALVFIMGDKAHDVQFRKFFGSSLMIDQPNGLAKKRRTTLKGKATDRRSVVLTNTVIDFLVHRHLRKSKTSTGSKNLSLNGFIKILRERYGFFVDEAPPGMSIPDDQLRKNRGYLERRLRDLGLFVGVNDAEAMKRLKQRFEVGIEVY
ncbi:MAG TPA: hypothetical protein VF648_05940 [Pyrinomonadaceae bacterium]|jgi:hypothetical protein